MRNPRRLRIVLFAAAHLFVSAACAETLYMWTDASGRVQYSDRPPKDFSGPVKRIETDTPPTPTAPAPKAPAHNAVAKEKPAPAADINSKRRAARERLQHDLDAARDKLDAARKALAEHQEPTGDERQIVRRPAATNKGGAMPGTVMASTRMNCRTEERGGKKVTVCPVSAPNEAYFDRIGKLQEEVRRAEEEVAAAELAYRRGTD